MPDEVIVTIKVGTVLQGDGGVSTGATVLAHKMADEYTDVILCYAPNSPRDPFVLWTYNHERGTCSKGDYFYHLEAAVEFYKHREY